MCIVATLRRCVARSPGNVLSITGHAHSLPIWAAATDDNGGAAATWRFLRGGGGGKRRLNVMRDGRTVGRFARTGRAGPGRAGRGGVAWLVGAVRRTPRFLPSLEAQTTTTKPRPRPRTVLHRHVSSGTCHSLGARPASRRRPLHATCLASIFLFTCFVCRTRSIVGAANPVMPPPPGVAAGLGPRRTSNSARTITHSSRVNNVSNDGALGKTAG